MPPSTDDVILLDRPILHVDAEQVLDIVEDEAGEGDDVAGAMRYLEAEPLESDTLDADLIEADLVDDDAVSHDDQTAEYFLGHIDDDYDEVVVVEPVDQRAAVDDVVMLDMVRLDPDFDLIQE